MSRIFWDCSVTICKTLFKAKQYDFGWYLQPMISFG